MTAGAAEMTAGATEDTGMIGITVPDTAMTTDEDVAGVTTGISGGRAKIQRTARKT